MFQIDDENYDGIKFALDEILKQIDEITELRIGNNTYRIESCFGGDMMFLGAIYGINAPNSNYPCIWCKCKKTEFGYVEKKWSISDPKFNARNIKEAEEFCKKNGDDRNGYFNKPLTKIEFSSCVVDLLHLFLRVTDTLIQILEKKIIKIDQNEGTDLKKRQNFKIFISYLEKECKMHKPFYCVDNKLKRRSFNGTERFLIFENCNELFNQLIEKNENNDNAQMFKDMQYIWFEFFEIFLEIKYYQKQNPEPNPNPNHSLFDKENEFEFRLLNWLSSFRFIFDDDSSYLTPYIHIFVYHLPEFLKSYDVNLFNLEGLEKLNHVTIQNFHRSSNKKTPDLQYIKQLIEKRNRTEFYILEGELHNDNDNDEN